VSFAGKALHNYLNDKPIVVSFEVTYSCTANCQHCNKGGIKRDEDLLEPAEYTALVSSLCPSVVQVSGGEPLLRKDVVDIVKAIKKHPNGLPYIILVTNGSLLNEKNYAELKEAGIDRFSVSLDFPNEKHDEFRRYPGLYAHLEETIPPLAADFGHEDIVLNSAITRSNLPYLCDLANKAEEWNVFISYSAYCILRTGDKGFFIYSPKELEMLHRQIHQLIQFKNEKGRVLNSTFTLMKTYEFFRNGTIPDCNAGRRFLVVRPNGELNPCAMRTNRLYATHEEILEDFSKHNKCGDCYVAIRAYSDKPFWTLAKDNLSFFFT
jgi:MoaA/NifB/PqqE/SkfB family radical SAM enzyme